MDWITIRGLRCWAHVGVPEEEKKRRQEVRIDLDLGGDFEEAGRKDQVEKTTDYAAVAREIRRWVEGRSFQLVEAIAEGAAALVLKQFSPEEVRIQVRKFSLPGTEHVGIQITRRRSRTRSRSPRAGRERSEAQAFGPARR